MPGSNSEKTFFYNWSSSYFDGQKCICKKKKRTIWRPSRIFLLNSHGVLALTRKTHYFRTQVNMYWNRDLVFFSKSRHYSDKKKIERVTFVSKYLKNQKWRIVLCCSSVLVTVAEKSDFSSCKHNKSVDSLEIDTYRKEKKSLVEKTRVRQCDTV